MLLLLLIAPMLAATTTVVTAFAPLGTAHSTYFFMTNQENDHNEHSPRDNFGRSLRGLQSSALKTVIETGDTVVCKQSFPSLGIYENTSYEVMAIYAQSFNEETQQVEKQMMNFMNESSIENLPLKGKLYISLFSPVHHKEPVVVSPEEVGLTTVRSELGNAAWLAIPGFFWVFVASTFYNIYHERTGGSFSDALWGR
jgi:hypothetical protein